MSRASTSGTYLGTTSVIAYTRSPCPWYGPWYLGLGGGGPRKTAPINLHTSGAEPEGVLEIITADKSLTVALLEIHVRHSEYPVGNLHPFE